jgi:hypothetical protein
MEAGYEASGSEAEIAPEGAESSDETVKRTAIQRKTPLKAKIGLKSRTALKAKVPLRTKSPLKQVSDKRKAEKPHAISTLRTVSPSRKKRTPAESAHLSSVVALGCLACRNFGYGYVPAVPHHIRDGKQGGRLKASDYETLPLCPEHHTDGDIGVALHSGAATWQRIHGHQRVLLRQVYALLGYPPPMELGGPNLFVIGHVDLATDSINLE